MQLALVNGRILRDSGWADDQVVLIERGHIAQIVARDAQLERRETPMTCKARRCCPASSTCR